MRGSAKEVRGRERAREGGREEEEEDEEDEEEKEKEVGRKEKQNLHLGVRKKLNISCCFIKRMQNVNQNVRGT